MDKENNKLTGDKGFRLSVCLAATLTALSITGMCMDRVERIEADYDYSTVKELSGVVTEVEYCNDIDTGNGYHIETIELENGREVDISIGGASPDKVGDEVSVYTDGKHYEFTQKGIALDNSGGFIYFIVPSLLLLGCLILCGAWFGWKGFLLAAVSLLLAYGVSEA